MTKDKLILDYPYVAEQVANEVSKNALDFFCKKFEKFLEEKGTIYSYSLLHCTGDDFYIHATLYFDKEHTNRFDNARIFNFEKIRFVIAEVMSFEKKLVLFDGQTTSISYIEELYKQHKTSSVPKNMSNLDKAPVITSFWGVQPLVYKDADVRLTDDILIELGFKQRKSPYNHEFFKAFDQPRFSGFGLCLKKYPNDVEGYVFDEFQSVMYTVGELKAYWYIKTRQQLI